MKYFFKNKNGFTIIELIISIFILSVALVGIFSAFSVVTILTSDSADRLTGTYLAQEGMEIVRNIRDTNWLKIDNCSSGTSSNSDCAIYPKWFDGLDNCVSGCEADYTTGTGVSGAFSMSPWSTGHLLDIDTNGFYDYNSGSPSKFERKIIIKCLNSLGVVDNLCKDTDYILKVTVQVSWNKKATILNAGIPAGSPDISDSSRCNSSNCITAEETLYNWYNTTIASADDTVTSSGNVYGVVGNTITGVTQGTSELDFLANLILPAGATWTDDIDVNGTKDGDTLTVTAQDGTTYKIYTISVNANP